MPSSSSDFAAACSRSQASARIGLGQGGFVIIGFGRRAFAGQSEIEGKGKRGFFESGMGVTLAEGFGQTAPLRKPSTGRTYRGLPAGGVTGGLTAGLTTGLIPGAAAVAGGGRGGRPADVPCRATGGGVGRTGALGRSRHGLPSTGVPATTTVKRAGSNSRFATRFTSSSVTAWIRRCAGRHSRYPGPGAGRC